MAQLEAEYVQARDEHKAKPKLRIDEVQAKARPASDRLKGRIDRFEQEVGAEMSLLEQRAAKAKGETKVKLDLRISELHSERERRSALLKQAWAVTKEAFELR